MDPKRFEEQQRNRLRGYFQVIENCNEIDVRKAIDDFIAGKVRNHNPAFCPTAPQLATHIREVEGKRLDNDRWDRLAQRNAELLLPAPERSDESRERVRQLAQKFARDHSPNPTVTETPEQAEAWLEKKKTDMLISQGVTNADGADLKAKTDIPVTPQLREILKKDFPIDG